MNDIKPIKTINDFLTVYGITQKHLNRNGVSYHASLKYGDTHIRDLPDKFKDAFIQILKTHKVKYERVKK